MAQNMKRKYIVLAASCYADINHREYNEQNNNVESTIVALMFTWLNIY